jgi:hypothetical protein
MEQLKEKLLGLVKELEIEQHEQVMTRLENLSSVYPFNEYEFLISSLMGYGKITLDNYYELRDDYIARNLFMYIFEISGPRSFGESWAQGHLKELVPELTKPSKKLDPNYSGEYDFYLDGKIRIEVKASRAVDADSNEPLYVKALASDSAKDFWMNFQQVKCKCCDVFVWVAVWRDTIRYWVLSSHELEKHPNYSTGQHRGNTGEGQLHLRQSNIKTFEPYEAASNGLGEAIRRAYEREIEARRK